MLALGAYAAFLIIALALSLSVGFVLKRHGEVLARAGLDARGIGATGDNPRIRSVNRLTLLGFSLVTAGAIALLLRVGGDPQSTMAVLTFIAARIGVLLVVLGLAHFQCLSVMARASERPVEMRLGGPTGRIRPRRAKEDPLDRVFEAARLDAPFSG